MQKSLLPPVPVGVQRAARAAAAGLCPRARGPSPAGSPREVLVKKLLQMEPSFFHKWHGQGSWSARWWGKTAGPGDAPGHGCSRPGDALRPGREGRDRCRARQGGLQQCWRGQPLLHNTWGRPGGDGDGGWRWAGSTWCSAECRLLPTAGLPL